MDCRAIYGTPRRQGRVFNWLSLFFTADFSSALHVYLLHDECSCAGEVSGVLPSETCLLLWLTCSLHILYPSARWWNDKIHILSSICWWSNTLQRLFWLFLLPPGKKLPSNVLMSLIPPGGTPHIPSPINPPNTWSPPKPQTHLYTKLCHVAIDIVYWHCYCYFLRYCHCHFYQHCQCGSSLPFYLCLYCYCKCHWYCCWYCHCYWHRCLNCCWHFAVAIICVAIIESLVQFPAGATSV